MATSTERFGFTKPAGSDPASVVPLNSNIDLIELYLGRTQDSIAPLYDDTETYSVGDLRTYESRLYKCNTDILTPETFAPEKWDLTTAVQEGGGSGGASAIEKTQAEYDALTPAQKTNGAIYMVQAGEQPQDTSGTFVTGSAQYEKVEVNCGFRPDYIEVTLPFSSGDTTAIYDASVSTTTSTWEIPQEHNKYTIELGSETGETGITDIIDTGFKFRCNASNTRGVTCTFTASKDGQDAVNKIYYMGTEYANTNGGSGGGGDGYKIEKIFDGNVTTTGNITLTKSIDNYDELIFVTNFKSILSESYIRTFNVDVSIFKNIGNYTAARGVLLNDWSRDTRFAQVKYVDNTTIDVEAIQIVSIVEIYGVKHSAGGGGGSSVEYSTDEHKVGTWIDGRDVYEKTYYIPTQTGSHMAIDNSITTATADVCFVTNFSYVFGNYINGVPMGYEVGLNSNEGVFIDFNHSISPFGSGLSEIYITIRYVKKAVS